MHCSNRYLLRATQWADERKQHLATVISSRTTGIPVEATMELFVELAKLGAIGVSVVCLILAFRWNAQITREASKLSLKHMEVLMGHARWTMLSTVVCLLIALGSEVLGRWKLPTQLGLELVPADLDAVAAKIKLLTAVSKPIRVKLAGTSDPIEFINGTGRVSIAEGNTLSVDVHEMLAAMQAAELIAEGERRARMGQAGL